MMTQKIQLKRTNTLQQKELEKAKEQFEKGLKLNPIDSDLLFNYGYLLNENETNENGSMEIPHEDTRQRLGNL